MIWTAFHALSETSKGMWELHIDFMFPNGTKSYLSYKQFAVGSCENQYQLSISGFDSIGLTDPFSTFGSMNGMKFSTHDQDNDLWTSNCAYRRGGWWHRSCGDLNLNNDYNDHNTIKLNGLYHNPPYMEMKTRPLNCNHYGLWTLIIAHSQPLTILCASTDLLYVSICAFIL